MIALKYLSRINVSTLFRVQCNFRLTACIRRGLSSYIGLKRRKPLSRQGRFWKEVFMEFLGREERLPKECDPHDGKGHPVEDP